MQGRIWTVVAAVTGLSLLDYLFGSRRLLRAAFAEANTQ